MESNLTNGLTLMIVGMGTVFTVLILVVLTSKYLVVLVNRFFPEIVKNVRKSSLVSTNNQILNDNKSVAVLTAAVDVITSGKGKIVNIEKM
ncbi:MAG: OadG family protein [Candidatus Delongbacteria bacterium]|nr:OadG family protein [Candidatus Delongbacteria bacterium]MBN2836649.1 OadG family protein [Candidatus Delongbacteria bacterium]